MFSPIGQADVDDADAGRAGDELVHVEDAWTRRACVPRSETAITESAFWRPAAVSDVPSIGSTATSHCGSAARCRPARR